MFFVWFVVKLVSIFMFIFLIFSYFYKNINKLCRIKTKTTLKNWFFRPLLAPRQKVRLVSLSMIYKFWELILFQLRVKTNKLKVQFQLLAKNYQSSSTKNLQNAKVFPLVVRWCRKLKILMISWSSLFFWKEAANLFLNCYPWSLLEQRGLKWAMSWKGKVFVRNWFHI